MVVSCWLEITSEHRRLHPVDAGYSFAERSHERKSQGHAGLNALDVIVVAHENEGIEIHFVLFLIPRKVLQSMLFQSGVVHEPEKRPEGKRFPAVRDTG
jgi:hypothetical protein